MKLKFLMYRLTVLMASLMASAACAHTVARGDQAFIEEATGVQLGPFVYLGAKHMVTGYDHLLFLFGVIFFLYRLKHVAAYVTLFAIGHSLTLISGVLAGVGVSAYLVDAIIGLSIVYKAIDNLDGWRRWFGFQPNTKVAVLVFGLFHGFGLATKVQDFAMSPDGLVPNLLAFNVGVELGQMLALAAILIAMGYWRRSGSFRTNAFAANILLMMAGFVFFGLQMTGYFVA
jgi:hypothetical protein